MKTKVAAIYGKRDVRIREFELPDITENETARKRNFRQRMSLPESRFIRQ